MSTLQQNAWAGKFGKEYTHRNSFTEESVFNFDQWNNLLFKDIGITRTEINKAFLGNLKASSVLEVGSNIGLQLNCFEKTEMFSKICGVEIQRDAISRSREIFPRAAFDIVQGVAENIPFKDSSFDLVVTNGLLIHISNENLKDVLHEVYRCSKKYIFGYEYFGEEHRDMNYRGAENLLFRGDFCAAYLKEFPDLQIVKRKKYTHSSNPSNIDDIFLLEKRSGGNV